MSEPSAEELEEASQWLMRLRGFVFSIVEKLEGTPYPVPSATELSMWLNWGAVALNREVARLNAPPRNGVNVATQLAEQLAQFYQPDAAKLWLFSRHQLLNGERPADRIAEGRTQDVLQLIEQLQSSAYL